MNLPQMSYYPNVRRVKEKKLHKSQEKKKQRLNEKKFRYSNPKRLRKVNFHLNNREKTNINKYHDNSKLPFYNYYYYYTTSANTTFLLYLFHPNN